MPISTKGLITARRSIFQQIIAASLIPMLVAFIALFIYSLAARLNDAQHYQMAMGQRIAENVAALIELPLISGNTQQLQDILDSVVHGDIVALRIYRHGEEQALTVSGSPLNGPGETISVLLEQHGIPLRDTITGELLPPINNVLGHLEIDISDEGLRALQRRIISVSSLIAALAVLLGVAIALRVSRHLSRPLSEIQQVTQKIASGDHQSRIHQLEQGELGELQRHINDMASAIEDHVEELRLAKAKAEDASMAKSLFLATMTHELRTPMNGALGMLQLLAKSELNDSQRHYLEIAKSSSEHLLHIVNDILDYSRIEKGDMEVESRYFPPSSLLGEILKPMELDAQSKGLAFNCHIDPLLQELDILGDETRLRQIVINLTANAVKFTHHGHINIELKGHKTSDQYLELSLVVADTGIGISADQQSRIFDSFHQADNSTLRRYGGSGLGLAIVKRLCELMGASISLESQADQGSRFTLNWRCRYRNQSPNTTVIDKDQHECFSGLRALVVEDNPVNQLLVARSLESWGAEVISANNGAEALERLQEGAVDIILMDLQMPVMDGFEATLQLRRRLNCNTPVIALTANTDTDTQRRCLNAGMNAFLSKPVSLEHLRQSIAAQLDPAS